MTKAKVTPRTGLGRAPLWRPRLLPADLRGTWPWEAQGPAPSDRSADRTESRAVETGLRDGLGGTAGRHQNQEAQGAGDKLGQVHPHPCRFRDTDTDCSGPLGRFELGMGGWGASVGQRRVEVNPKGGLTAAGSRGMTSGALAEAALCGAAQVLINNIF